MQIQMQSDPKEIVFYTGVVPKHAKPIVPSYPYHVTASSTSSPTSCINGRHLRPLGDKIHGVPLLKFTTSDPQAKLVIVDALTMYNARRRAMGHGIYTPELFPGSAVEPYTERSSDAVRYNEESKALVINLPPGSYTILTGLLGSGEVFIEHDENLDYECEGYSLPGEAMDILRKLVNRVQGGGIYTELAGKEYVYRGGELIGANSNGEKVGVYWEDGDMVKVAKGKKDKFCETCHQKLPEKNRQRRGEKTFRQKVVEVCDGISLEIRIV